VKRLLAFSTLPREGPSVRPRVLAYEGALADAGIELELSPFLTSRGFRGFYSRRGGDRLRKAAAALSGYARRVVSFSGAVKADGVLVHREIVPRGNRRYVKALSRRNVRYLYDLDDAIYLSPRDYVERDDPSRRRMAGFKDPAEVNELIAGAAVVLAGNETIAEHAGRLANDVRIQPTPVDTARFHPRERPERSRPLVGWIGSPTATYCLREILPALEKAAGAVPFDLLVVGAGEEIAVDGVRVVGKDWSLDEEPFDYASLDVGLYPLPDNAWTRAKCGMKALLYMASGAVPVVSPVGVNTTIVSDGRNGLFARSEAEWTEGIVTYLRDPDLRARHAAAALETVLGRWSLDALAPAFVAAVVDVLP
jgi:glycosyltransferase involved in cell wall biosynthesis